MTRAASRPLRALGERLRLAIGRSVLTALADDQGHQLAQVKLLDEVLAGVERFGEWGLISRPPVGAEAILAFVGGSRSHGVLLGTEDRRYRPKDADEGESGLYCKDSGTEVRLKPDGTVQVLGPNGKITIQGDEILVKTIGQKIRIDSAGDVEVVSSGDATVSASGTAKVNAPAVELGASGGSIRKLIDERWTTYFATFWTWAAAHQHQETGVVTNAPQTSPPTPVASETSDTKAS
jgi:phage baseplate assembly protein V